MKGKNGRYSNNDSERRGDSAESTNRSTVDDGSNIRTDDGSTTANASGDTDVSRSTSGTVTNDANSIRSNQQFTLTDGFYFTPSGDVARIPDGHYISNGRLRKRRRNNSSNSTDGNENRDRTETDNTEINDSEIPVRVKGTRTKKKVSEAQQRLTMVTMLSVASSAIFTSISLVTKHQHWQLETEEAKILAEALNEALATLPTKSYAQIIGIIEKWVPWVNLTFVIGAILTPRIEESTKRFETRNYRTNQTEYNGNVRTEDHSEFNNSRPSWSL